MELIFIMVEKIVCERYTLLLLLFVMAGLISRDSLQMIFIWGILPLLVFIMMEVDLIL